MKILVINPNYQDATSYYRAWGTFKDLTDRFGVEFTLYESTFVLQPAKGGQRSWGAAWPDLMKFDAVLFQRSLGESSLNLLRYCKELGLKIWYDLDDDLWNIPNNYKIKESFGYKVLKTIEDHIKESDLITCSTIELSKVIGDKTNMQAHVIVNAWDCKRFKLNQHSQNGITIWRGSSTHIDDIRANAEHIQAISKQTRINFMGYNPVKDRPFLLINAHDFTPPLDPIIYFRTLQRNPPREFLVPLKDNQFNKSKSNIAWLEATANGALTYSNGVGEFESVGLRFQDYGKLTETEINNYVIENQTKLINKYSLKVVNEQRYSLLTELID